MFSHGGEPRGYPDRLAGWQLAPGPLTAAAMQSVAAALCGAIGWIFDSAAAAVAALFALTDAWAHWRAADRIVFATRAPTAWAAALAAALAAAAAGAVAHALRSAIVPAGLAMLFAGGAGLVVGIACALAVLPLRVRDASGLRGWQCGRASSTAYLALCGAGAAVWLADSPWPDRIAAAALALGYAASVLIAIRAAAQR
jgi:hypothetical protein